MKLGQQPRQVSELELKQEPELESTRELDMELRQEPTQESTREPGQEKISPSPDLRRESHFSSSSLKKRARQ